MWAPHPGAHDEAAAEDEEVEEAEKAEGKVKNLRESLGKDGTMKRAGPLLLHRITQ